MIVTESRANEIKAASKDFPSITLDDRGLCDLELLAVGGFSPLKTFMGQSDYLSVLQNMRLADGTLWPLPVPLPVDPVRGVEVGKPLALRDVYGNLVGLLHVEEIYPIDKPLEAAHLYGTNDSIHPGVAYLNRSSGHYASGPLEVIRVPPHYDFVNLRRTPAELRDHFEKLGWSKVVAFQTSAYMHRSHEELARNAASQIGGGLLIQPVVGTTKPGDVDHYTRIRSYKALAETAFEPSQCALSLLTLAMRMAGPRDALLGSIISRNFGCTHFMVGPDHASPGLDSSGNPFYKTYAAQEFTKKYQDEIGISLIRFKSLVYLPDLDQYASPDEIPDGTKTADITADQVRNDYLARGIPLPAWFSRPTVSTILSETNPPKHKQGLTIWFTGLSGSGKSTIAHGLVERLAEYGRNVAFLDGDEIRTHLSKGLGFSKEDRDTNIHRVGYVAGLLAAQGGTTICSVVSPYRAPRDHARTLSRGNFVEIFCDTPIDICETRDVKGLYAKARAAVAGGKGLGFTGVDDPYEPPTNPEVTLDTSRLGVAECVEVIVGKLKELGFIRG